MQKKNGETAEKGFRGGFVRIKKMGRRRKIGNVDSSFEKETPAGDSRGLVPVQVHFWNVGLCEVDKTTNYGNSTCT